MHEAPCVGIARMHTIHAVVDIDIDAYRQVPPAERLAIGKQYAANMRYALVNNDTRIYDASCQAFSRNWVCQNAFARVLLVACRQEKH